MGGRFITFEGGEGAGKSTQARLLADALRARGLGVTVTREPGGSEGAELVRGVLLRGEPGRWTPRAEALLFAAARSDHVAKLIRPALERGQWVVCDRFLDSTRAYQAAGGVTDAEILDLHRFGSDGLLPDRTLLLELAPEVGAERAAARDKGRGDRFSSRNIDFHRGVASAFEALAVAEPARIRRIDAGEAPERVAAGVLAAVSDLLPA